jgi:hypothetical protein
MNLVDIIKADVQYVAGVTIEVDRAYGTVAIGDDIFLQGDEGYAFIDAAERLYEEAQYVTYDEVYAHLAKPYVDCLS